MVRLVALNWVELTQGPLALTNIPPMVGEPALATVELVFRLPGPDGKFNTDDDIGAPLPDDRYTLVVDDDIIDWKRIFARSSQAGIQHYFVEHDQPSSPFDSIKASARYLKELRF